MKPKVLIMSGYGINCEQESAHAFEIAGARAEIVHINDLISDRAKLSLGKKKLSDYQIMMFPGGFSYGDDTGSGNAFANKLKNNLWQDLTNFVNSDKLILGICNGFQIMNHLGLFTPPKSGAGFASPHTIHERTMYALLPNTSNRYECRWVYIKNNNCSTSEVEHNKPYCIFTKGIDIAHIPVAHGEGRFYCDKKTLKLLRNNNQIVFTYCDENGKNANGKYPLNPNGAISDIAGICDKSGRIMGMMPHPERAIYSINERGFHLKKEIAKNANNKLPKIIDSNSKIFKNAVGYFR